MMLIKFIFGCCWASFVTTMTFRHLIMKAQRFEKFSTCDSCHHRIRILFLIPILGFCLQAGKCFYCHAPISKYWTITEIYSGIFWTFQNALTPVEYLSLLIFHTTILIMSTQDWYLCAFSTLLLPGFLAIYFTPYCQSPNLITLLSCTLFCLYYFLPGLGKGDVDFIILITFFCGIMTTMQMLLFASCLALLFHYSVNKTAIPFVPFLNIGLMIAFLI